MTQGERKWCWEGGSSLCWYSRHGCASLSLCSCAMHPRLLAVLYEGTGGCSLDTFERGRQEKTTYTPPSDSLQGITLRGCQQPQGVAAPRYTVLLLCTICCKRTAVNNKMKPLQQYATRRSFNDLLARRGAERHVELKKINKKYLLVFILCVCVLAYLYVHHVHAVPKESRRGCWILRVTDDSALPCGC